MKLVDQWSAIERGLPEDWSEVRLRLRTEIEDELPEATRVLGSMGAGRIPGGLALTVRRAGGAASPEGARRLFGYLDERRVWCLLEQAGVSETPAAEPAATDAARSVAAAWDAEIAALPRDWSDLLCSLEITSSTRLDRAALLCAPLNPARQSDAAVFTFRAARQAGYGTSPGMVRRCFERLDEEQIEATVAVLRHLSESEPVATQGPVWLVGGHNL